MNHRCHPAAPRIVRRAGRLLAGLALLTVCTTTLAAASAGEDRFGWVFGWGLGKDGNVPEVCRVAASQLRQPAATAGFVGQASRLSLDCWAA